MLRVRKEQTGTAYGRTRAVILSYAETGRKTTKQLRTRIVGPVCVEPDEKHWGI